MGVQRGMHTIFEMGLPQSHWAYQKFFKEHAGYPKFKSKHNNHKSYTTSFTNGNIAVDFVHGKIKLPNTRKDHLHKISNKIIRENQVTVSDKLQIKNMVKDRLLARTISDVSWYELTRQLEYKAEWNGRNSKKRQNGGMLSSEY